MENMSNDKLYYEINNLKIYHENILDVDFIEDNSIDLIVTSPPYNVDIKYNTHNDKTDL